MDQQPGVRHVGLATGVTVAYVWAGPAAAAPVVLLHAWGESGRSFDRLLPLLPGTVHAMAMDQRGHGGADKPAAGYSLADFAADIEASPHRVAGLVLAGSPRSLQGRPSFADEVDQLTDPVDAGWVRKFLTWFPLFHQVPQWYIDGRVHDGVRVPAHVWREALAGLVTARPPTDTGTITAPTLIVWGARDELLTCEHQQALAAAIPASRLLVYQDTGHLVLWEQPGRLASDLTAFVESLSTRPA